MKLKPGLYIISTPIGNLEDITLRALFVLKNSDIILCEDTRVSKKLLVKHGIAVPLKIYNDQSGENRRRQIKGYLAAGKIVSLISDAGTPLISDPGFKLVREIRQEGYLIDSIPGPSAPLTALTLSGLPTDRFFFAGFIPKTENARKKLFKELMTLEATLIFFETSNRLLTSLESANEILGDRLATVARELTKMFQEVKTEPLSDLLKYYSNNPARGEVVLLISGKGEHIHSVDLEKEIKLLLEEGVSAKSIASVLYEKYVDLFSKNQIYQLVNDLKAK